RCRLVAGVGDCSKVLVSRTRLERSQLPVASPSESGLLAPPKLAAQMPSTLHASCAFAAELRIAPRPTKAEAPNVARSLSPSALNVWSGAGLAASLSASTSAAWRLVASAGASLYTGVEARMI